MDSTTALVIAAGCCVVAIVVIIAAVVIVRGNSSNPSSPPGVPSSPVATGTWKNALATVFNSYPACCPKSPNYDPKASKTECTDYSGCDYLGTFAAIGHKSIDWVKQNNIVSFFQLGQTDKTWNAQWANKKLRLRNPKTGSTLDVVVADTCGDHDCNGCCTKNAKQGGGFLVDMESNTASRFYGGKVQGESTIQFQVLS